ncbi:MAG: DUF4268 domain-containing protein [Halobacteriota archaeon]
MKKKGFILMPFSATKSKSEEEWTEIYQYLFLPAWRSFGIECERINIPRGQITKEIIKELYEAPVVFADLTDSNPNVMYELGIRHAFKKPSLLVKYEGGDIPFDVKTYMIHEYQNTPHGLKELKRIIKDFLNDIENKPEEPDNPVWEFLYRTDLEKTKQRLEYIEKTGIELMSDLKKNIEKSILQSDYVYNEILRNLHNPNIRIRERTIRGIAEIKTTQFVQPIIELLQNGERSIMREAIKALGQIGSKEATKPLLNILLEDSDDYLREEALQALKWIGDKSIVPSLLKILESDPIDRIRELTANVLGSFGDSWAISALSTALKSDPDFRVRSNAATSLGIIGSQEVKSDLVRAMKKDSRRTVRVSAIKSLTRVGAKEDLPVLIDILMTDEDEGVRESCVIGLRKIEDPSIIPIFEKILKKDNSGKVKGEIVESLGKFGNSEALDILKTVISDEDIADYDDELPITVGDIAQEKIAEIEYQKFYGELLAKLREKLPDIPQQEAYGRFRLEIPIGYSGVHLEWAFRWGASGRRDSFEVGVHFERQSQDENKQLFDFFKNQEDFFKKELGEDIQFQFPRRSGEARMYVIKNEGEMTDELKKWAVATMVKFYNVLKPKLDDYFHSA